MFWNINNNDITDYISALCHENEIDILVLAESSISDVNIIQKLNKDAPRKYRAPFNPSPRLSFFIRYPEASIKPIFDDGGLSIRHILPPIGSDILLIALHMPSKIHMKEKEQIFQTVRISNAIKEAEERIGHSKTMIMGDLNMNPFEDGIVGADGLHAVMDKKIASRQSRVVQTETRKFFYNPMWSRMGDFSPGPPGTYYYQGGHISYFWHTFDQVLLRPDLLKYYADDQLKVPIEVGGKNLLSGDKIDSKISDHLPIIITLRLEQGV